MDKNLSGETLLVVEEKEQGKQSVKAVTGKLDKNGKPKTVLPKDKNNPDFLKIDKHANVLENFFSNFIRQSKNPTRFAFFKVPINGIEQVATVISDILKNGYESGKELLDEYLIKTEDYLNKQKKEQSSEKQPAKQQEKETKQASNQTDKKTAIAESEVDWDSLKKVGISKEMLQQRKCLSTMLNYGKSPLLPVEMDLEGVKIETEARLAFRKDQGGKVTLSVHGVRQQPELDKPFYGYKFTDDEKKALADTGNMGKILDIKKSNGSILPVYVSVDKLTNEIVALRADKVKIPDEIKGVKLDDKQKQQLGEGKAVFVQGMTSKSGKEFSAHLQVNANRRGLEFIFDNHTLQNQQKGQDIRIPTKLGGVELTKQQQGDLKGEKTIYVKGLPKKANWTFLSGIRIKPRRKHRTMPIKHRKLSTHRVKLMKLPKR